MNVKDLDSFVLVTREKGTSNSLKEDKWYELLLPSKVIRDPVHGDIWITDLEISAIDTPLFQRLRKIKQLGPANLLYSSANHTRFEHCLGTLCVAQRIIESIERNYLMQDRIFGNLNGYELFNLDYRDKVLVRIGALLHDAAHVPYGHTLEKEGNLLKASQWADKIRADIMFNLSNEDSPITKVYEYLSATIGKKEAEKFLRNLKEILLAIEGADPKTGSLIKSSEFPEDKAIEKLEKPYLADIIGNTICADLVDYILRDAYFTGLRLSKELRLIEYFAVIGRPKSKPRLALLLIRKGKIRYDVISQAVEMLRQRFYLAERVYYHRVKTAASAMVINLAQAIKEIKKDKEKSTHEDFVKWLMKLGDEEFLKEIERECEGHKNYFGRLAKKYFNKNKS